MVEEVKPRIITRIDIADPQKLGKSKFVEIIVINDPKVMSEQFPKQ